jgi:hypothetical protein
MKKINYLFILFAILFSTLIIFISLQSANKTQMVSNNKLISGKFYVAKEILPDHSLYPLLMIVDRLRLELADSEERIDLLVSNANRRLFYSKKLLEKNNQDLAFTTLSKALKYINQALEENIFLLERASLNKKQEYQSTAFFVLENFDKHVSFYTEHQDKFSGEEKSFLDALFAQGFVLQQKLRSLMNQSIQN